MKEEALRSAQHFFAEQRTAGHGGRDEGNRSGRTFLYAGEDAHVPVWVLGSEWIVRRSPDTEKWNNVSPRSRSHVTH